MADLSKALTEFAKSQGNISSTTTSKNSTNGFAEPQNGFEESFGLGSITRINGGNGIVIALGVALSSAVAGFFTKFIPIQNSGIIKVIAAIVLKKLLKVGGAFGDFLTGVMLAGISELVGGLTSGLRLFGEPRPSVGSLIPAQLQSSPVFMQPPVQYAGVKFF